MTGFGGIASASAGSASGAAGGRGRASADWSTLGVEAIGGFTTAAGPVGASVETMVAAARGAPTWTTGPAFANAGVAFWSTLSPGLAIGVVAAAIGGIVSVPKSPAGMTGPGVAIVEFSATASVRTDLLATAGREGSAGGIAPATGTDALADISWLSCGGAASDSETDN